MIENRLPYWFIIFLKMPNPIAKLETLDREIRKGYSNIKSLQPFKSYMLNSIT